ncbi:hypothetical protein B0T09DRAFT_106554 [Sordaria sp. MPI-SDFR-AT-0083]|nr:hypothetical protein B0T09DRAFT_106554 [Sordaria sp. MPI-SDFR-AT-0083]
MIAMRKRHQCVRYRGSSCRRVQRGSKGGPVIVVVVRSNLAVSPEESPSQLPPSRTKPPLSPPPVPASQSHNGLPHIFFSCSIDCARQVVDMAIIIVVALSPFIFASSCRPSAPSMYGTTARVRHYAEMPPSSPMVVSRERKDRSSFWPEPRIVQMLVEQLRHHHIVALFVIRIHFDWTVVDKTGTFLQAILRAVCSHVRKATLSK